MPPLGSFGRTARDSHKEYRVDFYPTCCPIDGPSSPPSLPEPGGEKGGSRTQGSHLAIACRLQALEGRS